MPARRCDRRTPAAIVAMVLAVTAILTSVSRSLAVDSPNGKLISDVLPVGNRIRTADQIRAQIHTRPGVAYDEATAQEDMRRLNATKWFVAGGVEIFTRNDPDGRVTVLVKVNELPSVVQDVQFIGAQHLSRTELQNLSGVRKGEPMNPLGNELGRSQIQRKLQDDGRYFATVELIEGTKPTDERVIYNIVEGPKVKVAGIDFRGVENANTARLRTQLVTRREYVGFIGGTFNPASMDVDRQKLIDYYEALGYLDAQITPEVVPMPDVGHVRIVYHIKEGNQYRVAGKEIKDNKSFSTETLTPLIDEMKPGETYDRRLSEANRQRLTRFHGAQGINAHVEEHRIASPDSPNLVQVQYEVLNDRGTPDRVGTLTIDGNEITRQNVILNQLQDFLPGQILRYDRIDDAKMRLARLGIFDTQDPPNIEVMPNEFDSPLKDVRVHVHETRTGSFMVGGSYNTNAGVTGNITLNERNFDILRWPTSLDDIRNGRAFRGGGQELRVEAAPGTIFQRYSVTWRQPYLLDTPFGLTVSDYYFQRNYAEYNEHRYGTRVTLDRLLDPIWRASLGMRVEGVDINGIPSWAPFSISKDAGSHFLIGFRPGITRDTRDSYVYPTQGSVVDFGFEQVLGSYTFPVGTFEYSQFLSSKYLARQDGSGRHVLGLRTQVSVAGDNTPVFERFYGGGIRSFRGFTFRGLGPFENGLAVGGTFAWLNTIEYQIPIFASDKFHWAFFVDHGTVEQNVSIHNYRVAIGTGLRLNLPMFGPLPLAIDFAVPLNKG
ncbi:MAG TPA: outer membrane protein assembly factor BamA, partial [Gemmata sp.]|nr:outer membrane protein assembly factor BamA [Gemmata sp.]